MKLISIISACCLYMLTSCVEKFDIDINGHSELFVIDAMVTDFDSVQTVYIRRERESLDYYDRIKYPPIENATVHIEDNDGWSAYFEDDSEEHDMSEGHCFWLKGHKFESGRTYTITVRVGDREFKATETMVPLPNVDGLKFYAKDTKDGEISYNPIIYFRDNQPNVDNYYLFTEGGAVALRNGSQCRYVPIQRLSDKGFRDDLDGIVFELGLGAEWFMATNIYIGGNYYYSIMTISKTNYDYFGVMADQINSDGGIYKPTPTSPVTNFSGKDVQGQFIAASGIEFYDYITEDKVVER
ncbi:MAG: DUF4249 domain-containing protein [Bacteroidales bacterium]|nr:DUF4249 domain-containing protein [Bacteroidales bacterium]